VTLNKTRYAELEEALSKRFDKETTQGMLATLKDVLGFDPSISTYNKQKGTQFVQWRKQRAQELGISVWQYNNKKT